MEIKLIAFGQIGEITGKELNIEAEDLTSLKAKLLSQFPKLADKKFAFAVNRKLVHDETVVLNENDIVALMPPYSGG